MLAGFIFYLPEGFRKKVKTMFSHHAGRRFKKIVDPFIRAWRPIAGLYTLDGKRVKDYTRGKLPKDLEYFVKLAVERIDSHDRTRVTEAIDLQAVPGIEEPIGSSKLVMTAAGDTILWARRDTHMGFSRLVAGEKSKGAPTFELTVCLTLRTDLKDAYLLTQAYPGPMVPPELWENLANYEESMFVEAATKYRDAFWRAHAFARSVTPILDETLTEVCPYPGFIGNEVETSG